MPDRLRSAARRRMTVLLPAMLAACAALAMPAAAHAADCSFQGPGPLWHDAANWDCMAIVPALRTRRRSGRRCVVVDQAESVRALSVSDGAVTVTGTGALTASALSATGGSLTIADAGAMTGPPNADVSGPHNRLDGTCARNLGLARAVSERSSGS